ncbi:hypothetical protein [Maioricimonas rarisocia]|nr:hypothetical protein [Maioricimonas rarisocia]
MTIGTELVAKQTGAVISRLAGPVEDEVVICDDIPLLPAVSATASRG